jgi:hypothetical protein
MGLSRIFRVSAQFARSCRHRVRRPSSLPSIADIRLRCGELAVWAMKRLMHRIKVGKTLGLISAAALQLASQCTGTGVASSESCQRDVPKFLQFLRQRGCRRQAQHHREADCFVLIRTHLPRTYERSQGYSHVLPRLA